MRIEAMHYFLALVRTGSIRLAASELYITNQGLSQSIQQLEAELNVKLLYRHGKRLQPTAAGMVFSKYAEQITSLYGRMQEDLAPFSCELAGQNNDRLTIYVTPIISHSLLSKILSIFQKRFKDYPLSIIEMDAEYLLDNVALTKNSIAILQAPQYLIEKSKVISGGNVELKDLSVCPLLISAAPGSAAAKKSVITVKDLETMPLALYGHEVNLAKKIFSGEEPQIVFNSANLLLCRNCISKGTAVGFSNYILEKYLSGPKLVTIPFEYQVDMHTSYMYSTSDTPNPVLLDLIYIMRTEFNSDNR